MTTRTICLFSLLAHLPAQGAVTETWIRRYDGPGSGGDTVRALAVDRTGEAIIAGASYNSSGNADFYTAKYRGTNGALVWERRYGFSINGDDSAVACAVDALGNVVVTGYSYNGSGNTDFYTAKYNPTNGLPIWERRYNNPANTDDYPTALSVDKLGNVIVSGFYYTTNTDADFYTVKYSGVNGALLWEKRHAGGGGGDDLAAAVTTDSNGNVLVTGQTWNGSNFDFYTVKYAANRHCFGSVSTMRRSTPMTCPTRSLQIKTAMSS
jgi:hypothetical protein